MKVAIAVLMQAAVETLAAMAADIPFTIAAAQAALQFIRRFAGYIRSNRPHGSQSSWAANF